MRPLPTLTIDDPLAPTPTRPTLPPPDTAPVSAPARTTTNGAGGTWVGDSAAEEQTRATAGPPGSSNGAAQTRAELEDRPAGRRLITVAIDAIEANARQPRGRFDQDALQALADSITERGILQPPVVRVTTAGRLELIAGERRWRAARLAGLTELDVIVTDADPADSLQDAVMENVARQDLSPVDAARAYATLIEDLGVTRQELGRRVGQSRVSISNHLRLLDLPDDVLDLLDTGALTFAHGRALLLCDEHATRRALAHRAVAEDWSTRQLEDAARQAGAPRARQSPSGRELSADHEALAQRLGDAVSRATGVEVRVRATAGDRFTFMLHGHDTARMIASRLEAQGLDEPL